MAKDVDKKDDQPRAAKTKLNTIVSHPDAMKTSITSLQQEMYAGDFSARARRACNHGGNDFFC
jgi:peptide subunit release factor RF-3